jgi:septum formation protein
VPFTARPADVPELAAGRPEEVARENARRKALALADEGARTGATVLGVDTLVTVDGAIHGKPADAARARATLAALSGRRHEVLSGICAIPPGEPPRTALARTAVRFRALDDATLDWYVATGEWRERAGGYAIQGKGAALVAAIEGDYLNVVGLPVAALMELLPGILHGSA